MLFPVQPRGQTLGSTRARTSRQVAGADPGCFPGKAYLLLGTGGVKIGRSSLLNQRLPPALATHLQFPSAIPAKAAPGEIA